MAPKEGFGAGAVVIRRFQALRFQLLPMQELEAPSNEA